MIVELVKTGKKIGIVAVSHKVISNLLKWTCRVAAEQGLELKIVQRCDSDDWCDHNFVKIARNNDVVDQALANHEAQIVAGTVWLWARPESQMQSMYCSSMKRAKCHWQMYSLLHRRPTALSYWEILNNSISHNAVFTPKARKRRRCLTS